MASDVEVCSKALVKLGDASISDFSEGTTGPICKELFPELKLRVLAVYPWRFNTIKSLQLDRTLDTPPTEYKYAYQLPSKMLNDMPRTVWNSGFNSGRTAPYTDFNIFGDKLMTSAEKVFIDHQIEKVVDVFPEHVINLTIAAMAAEIAFPLTEQKSVFELFYALAWGYPAEKGRGGIFREARRIDSQGHPPQGIESFPLISVRHG